MRGYRAHYQKKWTMFSHFIGAPLVTLAILILFGWIKISVPGFFTLSVAWTGIIVFAIYYLTLDLLIGAATTMILIMLCTITSIVTINGPSALSLKLFVISFVLGGIFQLSGHAIEGKKPALFNNFFSSVVVAPLLITAEIFFMFGLRKALQQQIETKHDEGTS